jgi:hypothetical protein
MKTPISSRSSDPFEFDLDSLLHPAQAFQHPRDVIGDPDLTLNEKRAILASWASDACAVEAAPDLRSSPGGVPVPFDDIMEALRTLDQQACSQHGRRVPHRRRGLLRRDFSDRGNGSGALIR